MHEYEIIKRNNMKKNKLDLRIITLFWTLLFTVFFNFGANAQYTLQDNDVVVTNGIIQSCSYNFSITEIIIPSKLDGQEVVGIKDGSYNSGVFADKGISKISFPSTLKNIGSHSFSGNNLVEIDFSNMTNLQKLGDQSFSDNPLKSLSFNTCKNLQEIGWQCFYGNELIKIDFSGCSSLEKIGENALADNHLRKLDLSDCVSLIEIGGEAFNGDGMSSYYLPTPEITGKEFLQWEDYNKKKYKGGAKVKELWNGFKAVFK